ncbi:hypothetical protein MCOR25_001178 [Pyricularia grisea]|uniref:Uncharacterized protein n=1 Tax=Pyricularia grisea TaxID=148305 RepID=A0A6P8B883_PYRGI|nr:hypothetical protein PgNI_05822 [Pyricularia grisea]KAI6381485.1 hypothetical protein MCOR25_001178 [Pyricularia grisea]TLD11314.1 hypothetical protein PgNI_05822 [Pyricularia grisea]
MTKTEVRRLTRQLKTAVLRDMTTEADKTRRAPEHADCCRPPENRRDDKYNFGCRCRAERGRLLVVWDEAVAAAVEHLRRLCRRQLMSWELEEVRRRRPLMQKQKRAGMRFVFAPQDLEAALDAVREVKMAMLADDLELERAALAEDVGENEE